MMSVMNLTLTPEIEALIRQHLAHGCSRSPESVILKALHALQELETLQHPHHEAVTPSREEQPSPAESSGQDSLLVQWLHETAGPRMGLEELRRRLAGKISGTMAETVREGRNDRV